MFYNVILVELLSFFYVNDIIALLVYSFLNRHYYSKETYWEWWVKNKEISQVIFSAQKSCCTLSSSSILANSWHSLCQLCPFSLCELHFASYSWAWTRRKVVGIVKKGCVFWSIFRDWGKNRRLVTFGVVSQDLAFFIGQQVFISAVLFETVWIYNLFQKK